MDRIASRLKDPAHLYPLYILLLTMPGVPAIYSGSEWGVQGRKIPGTDAPLRPPFDPTAIRAVAPYPDLHGVLKALIALRRQLTALRRGDYQQLQVAAEQFAFLRRDPNGWVIVAVNASALPVDVPLVVPGSEGGRLIDQLNGGEVLSIRGGGRCSLALHPRWGRVLIPR